MTAEIRSRVTLADVLARHGRENNVTVLRLAAALAVFFGHSFDLVYGPRQIHQDILSQATRSIDAFQGGVAGIGVALFFLLSGCLITQSWTTSRSLVRFAVSRALRIFPLLAVVVCASAFILGPIFTNLPPSNYFLHPSPYQYALWNTSLVQFIPQLPGVFRENPFQGVNGSLWTLPVEARLYVVIGVAGAIGLLRARRLASAACAAVVAVCLSTELWSPESMGYVRTTLYFMIGALAFLCAHRIRLDGRIALAVIAIWATTYVVKLELARLVGSDALAINLSALRLAMDQAYRVVYAGALTYVALYVAFSPSISLPRVDGVGDLSYGVYLWAFPLQQVLIVALGEWRSPGLVIGLGLPVLLSLAYASWLFEARALARKDWLSTQVEAVRDRITQHLAHLVRGHNARRS